MADRAVREKITYLVRASVNEMGQRSRDEKKK